MVKKEEKNQRRFAFVKSGSFAVDKSAVNKRIHIDYSFLVGKAPVIFEEYDQFCEEMGHRRPEDSGFGRGRHPVINVSWLDAVKFCNWKSEKDHLKIAYDKNGELIDEMGEITRDIKTVKGWRLLTDAEWEYAAKGGHKNVTETYFAGSDMISEVAVFKAKKTNEVGLLKPNELGIFDMCGNVSEWCYDYYDQRFFEQCDETNPINFDYSHNRVIRGGNWKSEETEVRVISRDYFSAGRRDKKKYTIGFRIARTLAENQTIDECEMLEVDQFEEVSDASPLEKTTEAFAKEFLETLVQAEYERQFPDSKNQTTRCEFCNESEGTEYVFFSGDKVFTNSWRTDLNGKVQYGLTYPTDESYIEHTETTYNNFKRYKHRFCDKCLGRNSAIEKKAFLKNIFIKIPWVAFSVYFSFCLLRPDLPDIRVFFLFLAIINFIVFCSMTDTEDNWEIARKLSMTMDERMRSNPNREFFTEEQYKSLKPYDPGRFFI